MYQTFLQTPPPFEHVLNKLYPTKTHLIWAMFEASELQDKYYQEQSHINMSGEIAGAGALNSCFRKNGAK